MALPHSWISDLRSEDITLESNPRVIKGRNGVAFDTTKASRESWPAKGVPPCRPAYAVGSCLRRHLRRITVSNAGELAILKLLEVEFRTSWAVQVLCRWELAR